MEQFKASDEDWLVIELNAKEKFGVAFAGLCDLRDRVAALEAALDRVLVRSQTGEYLRAGTPVYLAAPAKAVPSDEELWKIWYDTQEEGAILHFRALFDHGYQQGLAAGRAEQQATTEPATKSEPEPSPSPAAEKGLVEVIADLLGHLGDGTARDVIRAVARWLRSMGHFSAATNLEREANR